MLSKKASERWDTFQRQKKESILSHKGDIYNIIYGAYNPPGDEKHSGEKERLIKLRDHLRNDGYIHTYLVEDFPSNPNSVSPNLDKSYDCLNFADLNILVFTCRGKTDSVVSELKYAIQCNLLPKCRVYEEEHHGIPAMGTLLKEELTKERYKVSKVGFENDTELYEVVIGDMFSFLEKHLRTT